MLTKVEELIDPHSGQWGEVLIRDVFSPVDAQRILQIQLNVQGYEDFCRVALHQIGHPLCQISISTRMGTPTWTTSVSS